MSNGLGNSTTTNAPTDNATHSDAASADVYSGTPSSAMRTSAAPQDTATSTQAVGDTDGGSTIGTVVTLVDLGGNTALADNDSDTFDQLQVLLVVVKCFIIGFIILAAILGNMLVIVSVMQHRKLRYDYYLHLREDRNVIFL